MRPDAYSAAMAQDHKLSLGNRDFVADHFLLKVHSKTSFAELERAVRMHEKTSDGSSAAAQLVARNLPKFVACQDTLNGVRWLLLTSLNPSVMLLLHLANTNAPPCLAAANGAPVVKEQLKASELNEKSGRSAASFLHQIESTHSLPL